MNYTNIRFVITGTSGSGYNYVTLMIGEAGTEGKDCGALYLSDTELNILSSSLRSGISEVDNATFDVEDTTLVGEY